MSKADPVMNWLLDEGRNTGHRMRDFGTALCREMVAAGIPVTRAFCGVRTLHPLVAATGYIWRHGQEAERVLASWEDTERPEFNDNPFMRALETGEIVRRRLNPADGPLDYQILAELRDDGMTDYVALPLTFSDGSPNPLSFQTDAPDGFSDDDIEALVRISKVMALIVEAESRNRVAQQVLDTYVGRRTGRRVLSGAIRRGAGETIRAVVWFSDLRGFTALTETLPRDTLIELLNSYFEIMGAAVTKEEGEILKFLGDGMLAIFELDDGATAQERCAAALRAVAAAQAAIADANAARQASGKPAITGNIALDLGELSYGNIGAPDRLDFTVIGPAVNEAARLQALAGEIGEPVVISQSFADALGTPLRALGDHPLKGVSEPQAVFAPAD